MLSGQFAGRTYQAVSGFLDKGIQLEDPNTSPGEMKSEQQATLVVLIKLTMGNSSKSIFDDRRGGEPP